MASKTLFAESDNLFSVFWQNCQKINKEEIYICTSLDFFWCYFKFYRKYLPQNRLKIMQKFSLIKNKNIFSNGGFPLIYNIRYVFRASRAIHINAVCYDALYGVMF